MLHDICEISYEEALNINGPSNLFLHRLELLILETYKSFHASITFINSHVRLTYGDQLNLYNQNDGPLPIDCDLESRVWIVAWYS